MNLKQSSCPGLCWLVPGIHVFTTINKKGVMTEIEEDFEIAVHDVTQGQWQAVMGDNPSYFLRFGGGQRVVKDISDEELKLFPVENVSWSPKDPKSVVDFIVKNAR